MPYAVDELVKDTTKTVGPPNEQNATVTAINVLGIGLRGGTQEAIKVQFDHDGSYGLYIGQQVIDNIDYQ